MVNPIYMDETYDSFMFSKKEGIILVKVPVFNLTKDILDIYDHVRKIFLNSKTNQLLINEIPHTQITKFKYVAEGGFGIIYKATWLGQDVAVKRFLNSQNTSKYFLNEVKALFQCYSLEYIIGVYGITQDIETKDFMLVMKYASGGDLHNHLQKNFSDIAWKKKLHTLWKISEWSVFVLLFLLIII
ncbi:hypothetical protein RhiirC2_786278 [Rhizophagus irregularis]|uniref:Protein kinase domain-containing protein n=1 Tax=Rhizophagus irregularis TaxID=588596 RepID=A0A2N1MUP3_9GLOM|nr:hypothetical protein RhiirC2_786278 [Rhizophagus irregularis]